MRQERPSRFWIVSIALHAVALVDMLWADGAAMPTVRRTQEMTVFVQQFVTIDRLPLILPCGEVTPNRPLVPGVEFHPMRDNLRTGGSSR